MDRARTHSETQVRHTEGDVAACGKRLRRTTRSGQLRLQVAGHSAAEMHTPTRTRTRQMNHSEESTAAEPISLTGLSTAQLRRLQLAQRKYNKEKQHKDGDKRKQPKKEHSAKKQQQQREKSAEQENRREQSAANSTA
eukprot:CAMPEP_0174244452 /NCGR_PEP_ID=MMETSP0417-20130205/35294_1 /TAXON_ID=242541 /ORGANISM="Mayorella sp, Strain BSH-02190019" /LENGTH=137 /DNA_ID=CAMNT_0015324139 /DNA_START=6 /DNA_END=415 /DNA_ORIENTATION=-